MQTKKNQTILFRILALLLICCLLPLSPVLASDPSDTPYAESSSDLSGEDPSEDPSEEPTRPQPQCAETGEHMYESFMFAENSVHTAYCLYCGESFTLPCEYGETPEYVVNEDHTHSVFCLLCGGEKREACSYEAETAAPTQDAAGTVTYTCSVCGGTYQETTLPPEREQLTSRQLGDVDKDGRLSAADARLILRAAVSLEAIPASDLPYADLDGNGAVTAADARLSLRAALTLDPPPARHDYTVTVETEATCTKTGAASFVCAYCGEAGVLQSPPAPHTFGDPVVTPATCTAPGKSVQTCAFCPAQKIAVLPVKEHSFGDPVVTPATCTKEGASVRTCAVCGEKETKILPATDHSWTDTGSAIRCAVCGTGAQGFMTLSGRTYHCTNGVKSLSWCEIGNSFYFFDRATGVMQRDTTVDGLRLNADGTAVETRYSVEKIRTFIKAKNILASITSPDDSVEEKKYQAFLWVMAKPYYQYREVGVAMQSEGFEMLFANDIFDRGNGCCGSTSYAFAFLAVEAGCREVYVNDDGVTYSGHAWVTMEGNNRVYDVIFAEAKSFSGNYDAAVSDYRKYQPRMTYVGG